MPVYGTQRARDGGCGSALGTFAARTFLRPNGPDSIPEHNPEGGCPPTVQLKGGSRRYPSGARNRRQVMRLRLVFYELNDPRVVDEQHVERNQRVLHPEGDGPVRRIDEQHPCVRSEFGPVHQTGFARFWSCCDLDGDRNCALLGFDR